jgi:hypothetical protein
LLSAQEDIARVAVRDMMEQSVKHEWEQYWQGLCVNAMKDGRIINADSERARWVAERFELLKRNLVETLGGTELEPEPKPETTVPKSSDALSIPQEPETKDSQSSGSHTCQNLKPRFDVIDCPPLLAGLEAPADKEPTTPGETSPNEGADEE